MLNKTMSMEAIAALRGNEIDTVRELLQRNKLRPNVPLADGLPPLAFALAPGQTELAELLLDAGADVDTRAGSMTALGCAIKNRDLALAKLLLARGADAESVVHDDGFTALGLAVSLDNPSEDMIRLLMRYRCSPDHLFTLEGVAHSPRTLAFAKKKHGVIALFSQLDEATAAESGPAPPTMAMARGEAGAMEVPLLMAVARPAKKGKGLKNGVERRRPGSHWSSEDFLELAELLQPYTQGAKFSFQAVFDVLPQHGRVTIQKHMTNAVGGDKGAVFERLSAAQWKAVVARLEETAREKAIKAAAPPAPKRVRVAGEDKPPKAPKMTAAAGGAGGGGAGGGGMRRDELPELSFKPLDGYVWFPGTEILFAPPQQEKHPTPLAGAHPAAMTSHPAAERERVGWGSGMGERGGGGGGGGGVEAAVQVAPQPVIVNNAARLQQIVREIQTRKR